MAEITDTPDKPVSKKTTGRPSMFRPEFCKLAYKLCLLGADEKRIADILGVSTVTLTNWKHEYPTFLTALKEGKAQADAEIAKALYHRAKGFSHKSVKIFCNNLGVVTEVPFEEHYPPDTTACIFWLKNRQPERWRDVQRTELTGKDGGPVEVNQAEKSVLLTELSRRGVTPKLVRN